jgi:ATP-binding cassette, subfamily B, bacterial PglK
MKIPFAGYTKLINKILFLLGRKKRKLPKFILYFMVLSLLELIGLGLIAPYLSILVNPETFVESGIYTFLTHVGFSGEVNDLIKTLGLMLILAFLLKSICMLLVNRAIFRFSLDQEVNLRSRLMWSYQNLPYAEFLKRNSSEYTHSIQILTSNFASVLNNLLRISSEFLVGMCIFAILAWTDIFALSILLIVLAVSMSIYSIAFNKKVINFGKLSNLALTDIVKSVNEGIKGIKEIRVLRKEKFFHKNLVLNANKYAEATLKYSIISTIPRYFLEFIMIVFVVSLVLFSINTGDDIESLLPIIGVFGVASVRLIPSASQILNGFITIQNAKYGLDLLVSDIQHSEPLVNSTKRIKISDSVTFSFLELKELSYSYDGNIKLKLLNNISLRINANESIGIIGTSGSGKTTLVNIMLGLLKANTGGVFFNGVNIEKDLDGWMSRVAYLPQNVFMVDDTLRRNIALGVEDETIDNDRIDFAVIQANLGNFINESPLGLDTILGEGGMRISGGQKQRVALARAFYFNREVLILDESTSALDNETEREVVKEIKILKGKVTTIIIAHRLSTLRHCDVIYKLDNGKIIEQGSYDEIINNK